MLVLSLEAMCPSQCCWAKISVAAGLVLLEGSGGKPILASSVSPWPVSSVLRSPFP